MIARGEARYHGHRQRHCAWHMGIGMGTGTETSIDRTSIGSDIGARRGHGDKHGLAVYVYAGNELYGNTRAVRFRTSCRSNTYKQECV